MASIILVLSTMQLAFVENPPHHTTEANAFVFGDVDLRI